MAFADEKGTRNPYSLTTSLRFDYDKEPQLSRVQVAPHGPKNESLALGPFTSVGAQKVVSTEYRAMAPDENSMIRAFQDRIKELEARVAELEKGQK